MCGSLVVQAAFAILRTFVDCWYIIMRTIGAHALASRDRSWSNMKRGQEPAICHLKAQELRFMTMN